MPRPYARGLVTVLHDPFEARLEIVGVHPGAACDGRRDLADGEAVFHHRLTRLERAHGDRKSTRLNSSHTVNSYAVFCSKKKIVDSPGSGDLNAGQTVNLTLNLRQAVT